jgi:hypothetical protein
MASLTYTSLPTVAQWKKDSSVTLAIRSNDRVLLHIDKQLELYRHAIGVGNNMSYMADALLMELFQSCNFWIVRCNQGRDSDQRGRYHAVLALFEVVVSQLATAFGITKTANGQDVSYVHLVARRMRETFGLHVDGHGLKMDLVENRTRYMDRAERMRYRLYFRCGLIYQLPWWRNLPSGRMTPVLAESSHAAVDAAIRNQNNPDAAGTPGYGSFVLTLDRAFYMARHTAGAPGSGAGIFHSSYTAGDTVQMAGTMLIQHGRLKGIRLDSGHYMPNANALRSMVMALKMFQVDCSNVIVRDHFGKPYRFKPQTQDVVDSSTASYLSDNVNRRDLVIGDLMAPHSAAQLAAMLAEGRGRELRRAPQSGGALQTSGDFDAIRDRQLRSALIE